MSLDDWKFAFTNGMTEQEQQESYNLFTIPESKKVSRTTLTGQSRINFKKHMHPCSSPQAAKIISCPLRLITPILNGINKTTVLLLIIKSFPVVIISYWVSQAGKKMLTIFWIGSVNIDLRYLKKKKVCLLKQYTPFLIYPGFSYAWPVSLFWPPAFFFYGYKRPVL